MLTTVCLFADEPDFRQYEEGKLSWGDFTSVADINMDSTSKFKPYIYFKTEKAERNDTTFSVIKAKNLILRNKVYVPLEERSDEQLRYYQIIFDIKENYRREIQDTINVRNRFKELQIEFIRIDAISDSIINEFKSEYKINENIATLEKWEGQYREELMKTHLPLLPNVITTKGGGSIDVGARYGFYLGETKEIIEQQYGYSLGFTYFTGNLFFYVRIGSVLGKVIKTFEYGERWTPGMNLSLTEFDLSVGYPLFDNSTHKLTPFLGWGVHEITAKGDKPAFDDLSTTSHSFITGLSYDLILNESFNLAPSYMSSNTKSHTQNILNIRLSLTNLNHSFFKGNSVMLSLGYSIFSRAFTAE